MHPENPSPRWPIKPLSICADCTQPAAVMVAGIGGLCPYHAVVRGVGLPEVRVEYTETVAPTNGDITSDRIWLPQAGHSPLWLVDWKDED